MSKEQAVKVMKENTDSGAICPELTDLLISNYDEINHVRETESAEAGTRYFSSFQKSNHP